jgi:thioesterase domain-containing protein
MQQAAGEVLDSIINFSGEAPGILLGYSWAGILAYEVAVQCRQKFNTLPLVILVDTVAPVPYVRPFEWLVHLLQVVPRWTMRVGLSGWASSIRRRLFNKSKPLNSEPGPFSSQAKKTIQHVLKLADAYRATQEPQVVIHLLRATAAWRGITPLDKDIQKSWKDYGWRRTSGAKIHIHRFSCGSHFELLRAPKTEVLAETISGIICRHYGV